MTEWISQKEAAKILGCQGSTIRRWCRQNKLEAKKGPIYGPHANGQIGWLIKKEDILKKKTPPPQIPHSFHKGKWKKKPDYFTKEYVLTQIENDVKYTEFFRNEGVGDDVLKRWLHELGLSVQLWNDRIGVAQSAAQKRREIFMELLEWVDSYDGIPNNEEIMKMAKNAYPFSAKDIIGLFETKPYRIEQREEHYHKAPLELDKLSLSE